MYILTNIGLLILISIVGGAVIRAVYALYGSYILPKSVTFILAFAIMIGWYGLTFFIAVSLAFHINSLLGWVLVVLFGSGIFTVPELPTHIRYGMQRARNRE